MSMLERIIGVIARRREDAETRRRKAFAAEFDRRRALVENDTTLSQFERDAVNDSSHNLSAIKDYMVRRRTWVAPYWAHNRPRGPL